MAVIYASSRFQMAESTWARSCRQATRMKANAPDRVTLIEDAAHLMTPFAGVGVNVGMQDALELSQAVAQQLCRGGYGSQMGPCEDEMPL